MMKRDEFDRSFGEIPQVFTDRIDSTLQTLKEEPPVRKFTLRVVALAMLIALTVCGIAYAIVSMQGQEWYYNNLFTAYQESEPERQQAILDNLQTDVPQKDSQDTAGLVSVTVQDYAWAEKQKLFTLSMAVRANAPDIYELHPMQSLDADGAYGLDPDDPESHAEHYLWTEKGFGLPQDVMLDPSKKLLLVDFADWSGSVTIGDTDYAMPELSYDAFDGTDGATIFVMEFDMSRLEDDSIRATSTPATAQADAEKTYITLRPSAEGDENSTPDDATSTAMAALKDQLCLLGYMDAYEDLTYDEATSQAVRAFQKANGLPADGVAGPLTQKALFSDASSVDTDSTTDTVQMTSGAYGREQQLSEAAAIREAIAQNTDENGMLTLCLGYTVTPFANGETGEASEGKVFFQVKIH